MLQPIERPLSVLGVMFNEGGSIEPDAEKRYNVWKSTAKFLKGQKWDITKLHHGLGLMNWFNAFRTNYVSLQLLYDLASNAELAVLATAGQNTRLSC